MRTSTIGALVAVAAVTTASLASAPAASAATVRYASPTGGGTSCTQELPCSLKQAVEAASDGDTVQLSADEYYLYEQISVLADDLTITGPPGITAPADFRTYLMFMQESSTGIPDDQSKLLVFGDNFRMQQVVVIGRTEGSAFIIGAGNGTGATYDRIRIVNSGSSDTLRGRQVILSNSVVMQTGTGTLGSAVSFSGSIIGSSIYSANGTAIQLSGGYMSTPNCSTTIRNTVAWGGYANLIANEAGGSCASVSVDYDYSWIPDPGGGSLGGGILHSPASTPTAGVHNLPNSPAVFDPLGPDNEYPNNLTLPADSPAIDAGCTASCSDHDYYGRPRPIGPANDIGAMEQSVAPTSSAVSASTTPTTAALSATLTPGGTQSTYRFEIRSAGTPAWTPVAESVVSTALFTSSTVSTTAAGLTSATDYEARLIASNDRGTWTSPTSRLRTQPSPAPPVRPTIAVSGVTAKLTRRQAVVRSTATVTAAGTISQRITSGKGSRQRTRCTTTRSAGEAGTYALTCRLGAKARQEVRSKALKLRIRTTLQTDSATAATTSRLTIRRRR